MRRVKRSDIPDDEILEAIRACRAMPFEARVYPYDVLADRYPPKVVLAKMEQMVNRGVLDYGVSLRTAWIVTDQDI